MNIVISENSPTTQQIVTMASICRAVAEMYPYDAVGCVLCGEFNRRDDHLPDCPYKMAQGLMRELGIEYTSKDDQ